MKLPRILPLLAAVLVMPSMAYAQDADLEHFGDQNEAHGLSEGNPIIPGLFADPSVAKFGDTYYVYSTTDGFGWPTGRWVTWKSKDFLHWSFAGESFPEITGQKNWAPGKPVLRDGRYWMPFTLQGVGRMAVADKPEGPFRFADGGKSLFDSIDSELFIDDDGTPYAIYGGTHIYVTRMKADLSAPEGPRTEIDYKKGYVEGPFMFKHNGIYYACAANLGYAEYRIIYGMSDKPTGPFRFPENNIIIEPIPKDHIWGTGHGNVERVGKKDDWVLIYLRSRMGENVDPFREGNVYRQICAEKLKFNPDGTIQQVIATRQGIGALGKSTETGKNLALGKMATASSSLANYGAAKAVDGGYGTRWIVGKGEPLVATAESKAANWRYKTEKPAEGWEQPAFDDSGWTQGQGGFGSEGTPGARIGTTWTGQDIWLRREFELSAADLQQKIQLRWHHDDAAEVYLNGALVAQEGGYTGAYQSVPLGAAGITNLKAGKNVLAIHCHQDGGGQYIDAGLQVQPPAWWKVDLGRKVKVGRTEISFNYPTEITPYTVEWSVDDVNWFPYASHLADKVYESPKMDKKEVSARYFRVNFPAAVVDSIPAGIWEFKAFDRG